MNCTRCGRDIPETATFCEKCLEDMNRNPLPPGSTVQLPTRKPAAASKQTSRKKGPSAEELVISQRKTIKWLALSLLCTFLLLVLSIVLLVNILQQPKDETPAAVQVVSEMECFT